MRAAALVVPAAASLRRKRTEGRRGARCPRLPRKSPRGPGRGLPAPGETPGGRGSVPRLPEGEVIGEYRPRGVLGRTETDQCLPRETLARTEKDGGVPRERILGDETGPDLGTGEETVPGRGTGDGIGPEKGGDHDSWIILIVYFSDCSNSGSINKSRLIWPTIFSESLLSLL